jgi:hypothetical protein
MLLRVLRDHTRTEFLVVAIVRPGAPARQAHQMALSDSSRPAEELAQALYEASDPKGVPWAKRGRIVREAWLEAARLKLATPDNSLKI